MAFFEESFEREQQSTTSRLHRHSHVFLRKAPRQIAIFATKTAPHWPCKIQCPGICGVLASSVFSRKALGQIVILATRRLHHRSRAVHSRTSAELCLWAPFSERAPCVFDSRLALHSLLWNSQIMVQRLTQRFDFTIRLYNLTTKSQSQIHIMFCSTNPFAESIVSF